MVGRPETHPIKKVVGFTEEMIEEVESWRAKQRPVPNLSDAIRRLVQIGLGNAPPTRPRASSPANAARAAELAAKVIDRAITPGTPAEERKVRKQKILEGPGVLRRDKP